MPAWVTAAFALAVFGGALGSLLLLFRKKFAEGVLVVSFLAVLAQMTYNLFLAKNTVVYGPGEILMACGIKQFGTGVKF